MTQTSFPREKIQVVLFEGIHPYAVEAFKRAGYSNVTLYDKALDKEELTEALANAHFVGIRSRTKLTAEVLAQAKKLMAVGCFCIGTNQVDLDAAAKKAIAVFNAPHSNTRSVAELVLAEAVCLLRGIPTKNKAAHEGVWKKSASGSYEIRGKTIGIIGYGHIGSQVSILAEAFGMRVIYYDVEPKLPMGNAQQLPELSDVLNESDVVTLHVPQAPSTKNLMNAERIAEMKAGSILINASRGNVVDLDALKVALVEKKVAGAAIDVFPKEPGSNADPFETPIQNIPNVILTPHIGGSTQEAQENIGLEVASKLIAYSERGQTIGSVNLPNLSLPFREDAHRLLHIHLNQPGILGNINNAIAETEANMLGQHLGTSPDIGYVIMDVDKNSSPDLLEALKKIPGTLRARVLY